LFNEFLLYAAITGAVLFGIACWLTKDKNLSWVISVIAVYFFPDPNSAKNLGNIANNITLPIQKGIYLVGWVAGISLVSLLYRPNP